MNVTNNVTCVKHSSHTFCNYFSRIDMQISGMRYKNYLKYVRDEILQLSQDKFAERMGGEEKGWYKQRVSRLEKGYTHLNDETINDIRAVFPQISYSMLLEGHELEGTTSDIDPLEALPEDERKLLENYRGMAERDRSIYRNMADTFVTDRDKPKPKKRKAE